MILLLGVLSKSTNASVLSWRYRTVKLPPRPSKPLRNALKEQGLHGG